VDSFATETSASFDAAVESSGVEPSCFGALSTCSVVVSAAFGVSFGDSFGAVAGASLGAAAGSFGVTLGSFTVEAGVAGDSLCSFDSFGRITASLAPRSMGATLGLTDESGSFGGATGSFDTAATSFAGVPDCFGAPAASSNAVIDSFAPENSPSFDDAVVSATVEPGCFGALSTCSDVESGSFGVSVAVSFGDVASVSLGAATGSFGVTVDSFTVETVVAGASFGSFDDFGRTTASLLPRSMGATPGETDGSGSFGDATGSFGAAANSFAGATVSLGASAASCNEVVDSFGAETSPSFDAAVAS